MNIMNILVTNDDGIESPGLKAAVAAALPLGNVTVVAPTGQQTSMGRSFHGKRDEHLRPIDYTVSGRTIEAYHADCSPARIVLHAMDVLFTSSKPDLVISGINYGENLGSNLTISGTVGAAIQAATMGIRAIAAALETEIHNHHKYADLDWTAATYFTRKFAALMLTAEEMPHDVKFLNINIPADANEKTPWRMTSQSHAAYFSNIIENPVKTSKIGDGRCVIKLDDQSLEPDSDIYAIFKDRIVSVTPLSLDMTARAARQDLKSFFNLLPPLSSIL